MKISYRKSLESISIRISSVELEVLHLAKFFKSTNIVLKRKCVAVNNMKISPDHLEDKTFGVILNLAVCFNSTKITELVIEVRCFSVNDIQGNHNGTRG
jgi:hypothetical protein